MLDVEIIKWGCGFADGFSTITNTRREGMSKQLTTKSKEIRNILEDYFECSIDECLEIAYFLNEHTYLDLYNIELNDCEDVADVMYELRFLI